MSADWESYAEGVSNVGGRLRIPAKPTYPGATSNNVWSLTGSQVALEVNTVPSATGGTDVALSVVINSATAGTNLTIQYRSEEHTSELQSLMRKSYAVFCL